MGRVKLSGLWVIYFFYSAGLLADVYAGRYPKPVLESTEDAPIRCAIEIGSGTTKLKLARVDPGSGKIVKVLFEGKARVPYEASLTPNHKIPDAVINEGIRAIRQLVAEATSHVAPEHGKRMVATSDVGGPAKLTCRGVARAAFREATNRQAALRRIETEGKISVKLLSQNEEAIMGINAAAVCASELLNRSISPLDLVVWDMGSGSQQISAYRPGVPVGSSERFLIYQGRLGTETLKKYVIEEIQKKKSSSPNPLTKTEADRALNYVKKTANEISLELKMRLDAPGVTVVGIGSVHGKGLIEQLHLLPGAAYRLAEVTAQLNESLTLPDKTLGGEYADTKVTNLILVAGYMEQLKLKQVLPMDMNLTQAVLMTSSFWD